MHGEDDIWKSRGTSLEERMVKFYEKLFQTAEVEDFKVCGLIKKGIAATQNERLMEKFTTIKVKGALNGMHPDKAPRKTG